MESPQAGKKFRCKMCGRDRSSLQSLRNHLKVHKNGRQKCPKCPKDFCNKQYLKIHLVTIHKVVVAVKGLSKLVCPLCDRQFATKVHLIYHLKIGHFGFTKKEIKEQYEHECYFCKSKWRSIADLEVHLRSHILERPFKCNDCGKTCKFKQGLDYHQKKNHK